jgi:hypothetical protein
MGSRRRSCGLMILMLRLALRAPETVQAILNGRQPVEMPLDDLL